VCRRDELQKTSRCPIETNPCHMGSVASHHVGQLTSSARDRTCGADSVQPIKSICSLVKGIQEKSNDIIERNIEHA
jgi:hypothetical protein